jgi:hypothetical protein
VEKDLGDIDAARSYMQRAIDVRPTASYYTSLALLEGDVDSDEQVALLDRTLQLFPDARHAFCIRCVVSRAVACPTILCLTHQLNIEIFTSGYVGRAQRIVASPRDLVERFCARSISFRRAMPGN